MAEVKSVLIPGAPDLLAYLPGKPRMGAPDNISAIIRGLEEQLKKALHACKICGADPDHALDVQIVDLRDKLSTAELRLDWMIMNIEEPIVQRFWYASTEDYLAKYRRLIDKARGVVGITSSVGTLR